MELPSEESNFTASTAASSSSVSGSKVTETLSKNKLKKLKRYERCLQNKKIKRAKEREARKLQGRSNGKGNDEKLEEIKKLNEALENGNKVVIDCQFQNQMSPKELTRFARQLGRVYSSNRSVPTPLHLYLSGLSKSSELFNICCKHNEGFAKYVWDVSDKSVTELFDPSDIVYLTPDAPNPIPLQKGFESQKVYVIGGYVDETTAKNQSKKFAKTSNIMCARLPIHEFFKPSEKGTFKTVLTVNQVVDIILEWHKTRDWVTAIKKGLPERTGFTPRLPFLPD